jgi:hypothetical protein
MSVGRTLGVLALVLSACIPMRTLHASTATYLTPAGASVKVDRTASIAAAAVQDIFSERGCPLESRSQVSTSDTVLFFRCVRVSPVVTGIDPRLAAAAAQVGSWFAVRVKGEHSKSVVSFFGKPTVNGTEVCGDGDDELEDTRYTCVNVRVRKDWPAVQLVEGREETQFIASAIAALNERFPDQ